MRVFNHPSKNVWAIVAAIGFLFLCCSESEEVPLESQKAADDDASAGHDNGFGGSGAGTGQTATGGHGLKPPPAIIEAGLNEVDADAMISIMCPDMCNLDVPWKFDCYQHQASCVFGYDPKTMQYCVVDKKYCSWSNWATWCTQLRQQCNVDCTKACTMCSDNNGCHLSNPECNDVCTIDLISQ